MTFTTINNDLVKTIQNNTAYNNCWVQVDLVNATVTCVDFVDCDFRESDFLKCKFVNCTFVNCDMSKMSRCHATYNNCEITHKLTTNDVYATSNKMLCAATLISCVVKLSQDVTLFGTTYTCETTYKDVDAGHKALASFEKFAINNVQGQKAERLHNERLAEIAADKEAEVARKAARPALVKFFLKLIGK